MFFNLFLNLILKPYFFNAGGRTFDVSKIAKNQFYTFNIDRITKLHEFHVKNISTRHTKQTNLKNIV